jgi:hypothetical protein
LASHVQHFLLLQPKFVTAVAPLRQVLLADGFAAEFRRDYGLHFGQGIEPGDQRARPLAILEPAVEFLLHRLGQASDFAIMGQVHKFNSRI